MEHEDESLTVADAHEGIRCITRYSLPADYSKLRVYIPESLMKRVVALQEQGIEVPYSAILQVVGPIIAQAKERTKPCSFLAWQANCFRRLGRRSAR